MPIYKFNCPKCNIFFDKLLSVSNRNVEQLCGSCGLLSKRIYDAKNKTIINELGSKYHGKSGKRNINKILKERSRKHMIENAGEIIERNGYDAVKDMTFLKNGKKRTSWDEK